MNGFTTRPRKKSKDIHMETSENKNTTTPNQRDTTKVVLRGKFTAIQSYIKKQ